MSVSRFATQEEIFSAPFQELNNALLKLHRQYHMQDHVELNRKRFSWTDLFGAAPVYYGARFWEYPFAILAADLKPGMKVADIGCGTTPFTVYLAKQLGGENVTGFDSDLVEDELEVKHSHFGIKRSFIRDIGIHFVKNDISKIDAMDETFDVVFCISVLEHLTHSTELGKKQSGIAEMARIVKPGGKLILTFDVGIKVMLNDILNTIRYSGLIPIEMDLRWPQKRFVNYGDGYTVDVYGLVLEKTMDPIYLDSTMTQTIPMYKANDKVKRNASFYAVDHNQILASRDLRGKWGGLKVFIKNLLGRYGK